MSCPPTSTAICWYCAQAGIGLPLTFDVAEPQTACGHAAQVSDCGELASFDGAKPLCEKQAGG